MDKKILIIVLLALVVISTSATLVLSDIEEKEDSCSINENGSKECYNTCSWCYKTNYLCNTNGICC